MYSCEILPSWKPSVKLEDGIRAEVEWFTKNSYCWQSETPKI